MALSDLAITEFLSRLASKTPAPGGGATVGLAGAMAAAQAEMVVAYSAGRAASAEHASELEGAAGTLRRARDVLLTLMEEDAEAYGAYAAARGMPTADPARAGAMAEASRRCLDIPRAMVATCAEVARTCVGIGPRTSSGLRSDLVIAVSLADAAGAGAARLVEVNAAGLAEEERAVVLAESRGLSSACRACRAALDGGA